MDSYKSLIHKIEPSQTLWVFLLTMIMVTGCVSEPVAWKQENNPIYTDHVGALETPESIQSAKKQKQDEENKKLALANQIYQQKLAEEEYNKKIKSGKYPFIAVLTCDLGVSTQPPQFCFYPNDFGFATTFELQNGSFYKMYQYIDLDQAGYGNYFLKIPLENSFKITTQNSNNYALLNLKIKDSSTGKIIFEKSAGYYGIISVKN